MAAADLVVWLAEATLAGSIALLLALALRGPLRALFGASAAYAAWAAVPVALFATLLPALPSPLPAAPLLALQAPVAMLADAAPHRASPDFAARACVAWLGGCAAFVAWLGWRQRRFVRGLGRIADGGDGMLLAEAVAGLPAVVGLLHPRIVMPADALSRYDADERGLMLAHEREHIAHGDLLANAGVVALRCIFWFNPLLHHAARRFRDDQELACDARVIARNPRQRRAYGEAMLKTQLAGQVLPLGCHWGQSHPLKERIEMLKRPLPSTLRHAGGRAAVVVLLLAAGYAAWAAQPSASPGDPASAKDAVATSGEQAGTGDKGATTVLARESGNVAVEVVRTPPPVYPADLAKQGVTGRVVLIVDVAADGSVSAVKVDRSAGEARLDAAALEAARQWQFKPLLKHGKPMASQVRVPIDFEMDDAAAPVQPARAAFIEQARKAAANDWGSYDRMVRSLSASWQPQAATQEDEC